MIYFYYKKIYLQDQSIQKINNLILKKTSLVITDSEVWRRNSVDEQGSVARKSSELKQIPSYKGPSYQDTSVYRKLLTFRVTLLMRQLTQTHRTALWPNQCIGLIVATSASFFKIK